MAGTIDQVDIMRLAFAILMLSTLSAVAETSKLTHNESLINAFQVMCTLEPSLDFERIDAKAAAMRMVTIRAQAPSEQNGISVQGHIWGGHLTTGPFVLHLYEQRVKTEAATSCGVSGPVDDADRFRDDFARVMRLPSLPQPNMGPSGRAYIWNDYTAPNHRLILRDARGEDGKASAIMTLSEKGPR